LKEEDQILGNKLATQTFINLQFTLK